MANISIRKSIDAATTVTDAQTDAIEIAKIARDAVANENAYTEIIAQTRSSMRSVSSSGSRATATTTTTTVDSFARASPSTARVARSTTSSGSASS